jgi:acyl-ACP thioesterase
MIYQFDSRVRYSEVDEEQNLTLNGVLNYFQDCTTFHSQDIGLGIDYLEQERRVWILSSWQIVIERLPKLGDPITVQTWAYGFKAFYGDRNFALRDEKGELLVWANSLWVYMDLDTGRPTKPEFSEVEKYGIEEKLDMDYAPRKIKLQGEMEERETFQVLRHQLDTNHHMNNGQYVQVAREFLPEGFSIRQMRAEYKKSAMLYDTILPMVYCEKGRCTVALCDREKKPYAVIEFESKEV